MVACFFCISAWSVEFGVGVGGKKLTNNRSTTNGRSAAQFCVRAHQKKVPKEVLTEKPTTSQKNSFTPPAVARPSIKTNNMYDTPITYHLSQLCILQ